jgi:hypothetical protein
MQFTNAEKAKEAQRETDMRKEVYARQGMTGLHKMRIAMMQEIADEYAALAAKERLL